MIPNKYRAPLLMLLLAITFMAGHFAVGLVEYRSEQATHGEPFLWGDYIAHWATATLENWQSEFLQLFVQLLVVAGFFAFWKATEYDPDQEEIKAMLRQLLKERP